MSTSITEDGLSGVYNTNKHQAEVQQATTQPSKIMWIILQNIVRRKVIFHRQGAGFILVVGLWSVYDGTCARLVGPVWFLLCSPLAISSKERSQEFGSPFVSENSEQNQIVSKASSEISRCFMKLNALLHLIRYYWLLFNYLKLRNRAIWAVTLLWRYGMVEASLPFLHWATHCQHPSKELMNGFLKENRCAL